MKEVNLLTIKLKLKFMLKFLKVIKKINVCMYVCNGNVMWLIYLVYLLTTINKQTKYMVTKVDSSNRIQSKILNICYRMLKLTIMHN